MRDFIEGDTLYRNPLAAESDMDGWVMEGDGAVSFARNVMKMESLRSPRDGQAANIVHWCPETFPDNISVSWDFRPLCEPGLAILFFAAEGRKGEDLFDGSLARREGPYNQYHHGDINALHVSYFRRNRVENEFQLCNLRKSHGHYLVSQGPDPIPSARFVSGSYRIKVIKCGPYVDFSIAYGDQIVNCLKWRDDGRTYGPVLKGGKIGFRQMSPLAAEYSDLVVRKVYTGTEKD